MWVHTNLPNLASLESILLIDTVLLECGNMDQHGDVDEEWRSYPTGSSQLKELGKELIGYICRRGFIIKAKPHNMLPARLATMEDICDIPQSKSHDLGTRKADDVALSLRLRIQENKGLGGNWCRSPSLKIRVLEVVMLKDRGLMSMTLEDCPSLPLADKVDSAQ